MSTPEMTCSVYRESLAIVAQGRFLDAATMRLIRDLQALDTPFQFHGCTGRASCGGFSLPALLRGAKGRTGSLCDES